MSRASRDGRFGPPGVEIIARSRGRGSPGGRANATRRRAKTRLWTGNPTREDAGCRRRERVRAGESLKIPRQAGRCPGRRGSGAEPGGAPASSVVGEGRTFSPTRAPAMTTATYTLERCWRRERWGETARGQRRGWSLVEPMCGKNRGEGARTRSVPRRARPKARTHRHGRPVESLEHDDRAVGLRCQRTPAVAGGSSGLSGNPDPGRFCKIF